MSSVKGLKKNNQEDCPEKLQPKKGYYISMTDKGAIKCLCAYHSEEKKEMRNLAY